MPCRIRILSAVFALLSSVPGAVQESCGHGAAEPGPVEGGRVLPVVPPAMWVAGDTHPHLQVCGSGPDITPAQLYGQMQQRGVAVCPALFWNPDGTEAGMQQYFSSLAPQITGVEDPLTAGDPDFVLQYGVEVSGFGPSSQLAHVAGIHISDGAFPLEPYSAPILDFFRAQPGGLAGYSHVRWKPGYVPVQPDLLPHTGSSTAAVDLALGKVDFLEVSFFDRVDENDARFLYYSLLNSGLRTALTGGSDNTCISPAIGDYRGYALTSAAPVTMGDWAQAVRAGRTTVSIGTRYFLDLEVGGAEVGVGIGGELRIEAPGTVPVRATLHAGLGGPSIGTIELVQDGMVAAAQPFALPSGGVTVFETELPFAESGWVCARVDGLLAHTSAAYVIIGDQPITSARDAQYWSETTTDLIDNAERIMMGTQTQEALDHFDEGRRVLDALAALDRAPPAGVTVFGVSTPACQGPMAIGVLGPPDAGATDFGLTCLFAPPDATGAVVYGNAAAIPGLETGGITLHVPPEAQLGLVPVTSNGGGYAELPVPLAVGGQGVTFAAQFVWTNPPNCGTGILSASDALAFTVQ